MRTEQEIQDTIAALMEVSKFLERQEDVAHIATYVLMAAGALEWAIGTECHSAQWFVIMRDSLAATIVAMSEEAGE